MVISITIIQMFAEQVASLKKENGELKEEIIGAYCELSVIQYELAMETEQKEHMKETFLSIKDIVETNAPHIKAPHQWNDKTMC